MCAWQAVSASARVLARVLTQSRKSRMWKLAGYPAILAPRPTSRDGELATISASSPVSTQPVSPSKRTGHEPSGSQPLSRKMSLTPLPYVAWSSAPLGSYSTGAVLSASLAHWQRSTQCEPHSRQPPPTSPPPFSKLNPSSSALLNGRQAAGPKYISQSTCSLSGSGSAGSQPLVLVERP